MTVNLNLDADELLCLRMALVNRLNYIDNYEVRGGVDSYLAREKLRAHKLLSALPLVDPLEGDIRALLASDKYIEAIKLHRTRTGSTLKDAKVAVDALKS